MPKFWLKFCFILIVIEFLLRKSDFRVTQLRIQNFKSFKFKIFKSHLIITQAV